MIDIREVSIAMGFPKSILDQLGIKPNDSFMVKETTDFNKTIEYVFVEGYEDFEL